MKWNWQRWSTRATGEITPLHRQPGELIAYATKVIPASSSFRDKAYALYNRFAGIWRSRIFLFGVGKLIGIPNVGKKITPQADDFVSAHILVIRPDVLGDLIMTLPFLVALKRQLAGARITLAAGRPWMKFVEQLHVVDDVIEYPLNADPWRAFSNVFRALAFGLKNLKKRKFDLVLYPRWDADFLDAHLVAFFSYAPQRIAFFEQVSPWKVFSNRGRDAFYTHVVADKITRHEAERSLYLLEALGLSSAADEDGPDSFSIREKIPPVELNLPPFRKKCPLIGIFPGVQDPARQWPVDNFIETARKITAARTVHFLVFGTEKEAVQCERFARELSGDALNLSGKTELINLAGALRQCSVVISCNSGGAHLAGVLEVPVVAIFSSPSGGDPDGPVSPERFRPMGRLVRVLQPGKDPSSSVTADQVAETALQLMDRKG
jgi:ADP-heptose:LPS heptosyltransferase